ncbi:MAG: hypothetical protein AVDCRST_MAG89-1753 [uncultured Gemmatimonadetes bacterium]|uniref:Uncharacterized protein n=1 Tax=uncultured Gemmatimonadota bacterium TaxID=203437 RepID=A0A6J4L609_9BACT|nr:MAG: hypothetical protein AVDCRST_MAG89-1753 [uncultured Gemmatimonadota bacterium]
MHGRQAPAPPERVNPPLGKRKAPARAAVASRPGLHLHARRTCRIASVTRMHATCRIASVTPTHPPAEAHLSSRWSGPGTPSAHHGRQRLRDPPHNRRSAPERQQPRSRVAVPG